MSDELRIIGRVHVVLRDEDGNVKQDQVNENAFSATGLAQIVEQLVAAPAATTKPTHMSVGSGTPSAGSLTTHVDTNALTSKTRSTNVLTMIGDWAAGDATATLTEVATRDAIAGNYLSAVALSPSVAKAAGDTLQVTYTWTIA